MKIKYTIDEICDYLAKETDGGTARGVESMLEDLNISMFDLPKEKVLKIDETVFECARCGWTLPSDMLGDCETECICIECDEEED